MKITTIIGARPQFIKASALSRIIRQDARIKETVIHTGQHYDANMSGVFFDELNIPHPTHNLNIGGLPHGAMTGRMLEAIEQILLKGARPDWVLVYGDTNSTLAGALAAVKLHIPVAHVEAGLRSYNSKMPEEVNRILTDQCSKCLFTPSDTATRTLQKEGFSNENIMQVGDIMYDASLYYKNQASRSGSLLDKLSLTPKRYALATIHRQENNDHPSRLKEIFEGFCHIAEHVAVVLPLHPRTKATLIEEGLYDRFKGKLHLIDPVGYLDMLQLESNAKIILTDSGGVQKEAFFFQVPCITLRDETEWVELVEHGYNQLVSADRQEIATSYQAATEKKLDWSRPLYGDGTAASKILDTLIQIC